MKKKFPRHLCELRNALAYSTWANKRLPTEAGGIMGKPMMKELALGNMVKQSGQQQKTSALLNTGRLWHNSSLHFATSVMANCHLIANTEGEILYVRDLVGSNMAVTNDHYQSDRRL